MARWYHSSAAAMSQEETARLSPSSLLKEVFTTQILPYQDPDVEALVEQWAEFEWRGVRRARGRVMSGEAVTLPSSGQASGKLTTSRG
ncbi:MAG TPA: hypothetical protein VGT24_02620 [Candidatus Acidoferrales bacterium]|nr:hypothetical protein [Candidatus Acidoferrales bacterium]